MYMYMYAEQRILRVYDVWGESNRIQRSYRGLVDDLRSDLIKERRRTAPGYDTGDLTDLHARGFEMTWFRSDASPRLWLIIKPSVVALCVLACVGFFSSYTNLSPAERASRGVVASSSPWAQAANDSSGMISWPLRTVQVTCVEGGVLKTVKEGEILAPRAETATSLLSRGIQVELIGGNCTDSHLDAGSCSRIMDAGTRTVAQNGTEARGLRYVMLQRQIQLESRLQTLCSITF